MRHTHGFILLIVLLFLQIFAILSLNALENYYIEMQITQAFWHKHLAQSAADNILKRAEQKVLANESFCAIPITASHTFIKQPLDWWQSVSCAGNFNLFQYYYVIESLGADPCSYIKQDNASRPKKVKIDYIRLTLLVINNVNAKDKVILQSVLAIPGSDNIICPDEPHLVTAGRQSWRELI